ncbi:ATP synthase F1 subunit epsilon [Cryomorphaceae bacterium 1068]|jgi:F-type H+-transporting ATPase subunit epsilon|nr:ATP synthase F1 subunit epsilon [Cryomorphaceae bacterium 1068]
MNVDIITPDESLYSGDATSVTVPGIDGSLGILDRHAPLISALKKGQVKVTDASGKETTFDIDGGVAEVKDNKVIILAE